MCSEECCQHLLRFPLRPKQWFLQVASRPGHQEGGAGHCLSSAQLWAAKEREEMGVSCQRDLPGFREQGAEVTPTASVVKSKGRMTEKSCCFYVVPSLKAGFPFVDSL